MLPSNGWPSKSDGLQKASLIQVPTKALIFYSIVPLEDASFLKTCSRLIGGVEDQMQFLPVDRLWIGY